MAEVQFRNVTKIFPGDVYAVDNMTLDIADREFIVLVGPSGCGKTTTLRMVAGLEEVSSGEILLDKQVINDVPPKRRDIAMVFQNYALYPHMTVYKNMAFGLKLRHMPKAEIRRRVMEAAKMLGIEELLDRKPRALSGGQRQRVALGRAIVRHPKAFLFDEPLSNLDAKMRVETRAELKHLHQRLQTTTIYVTHDQEEAMTLGDRIVVMKDGVVQQCDSPIEVYNRPVNRFVAGFVGTPPMNFLTGRIECEGQRVYFNEGSARLLLPPRLCGPAVRYDGKEMVLGVRPEVVELSRGEPDEQTLAMTISVVEPLGEKMDVYASTPAHERIICRVKANSRLRPGELVMMRIDMDRIHVFEPGETGVNVGLDGERVGAHA